MTLLKRSGLRSTLISLGGIAFGFLVGGVVIALTGKPVVASLSALFDGSFGSLFALGNTLNKAAALLFIACGYIYAARGGFVSIGSEGQLHVGGLIGAAGAIAMKDLPRPFPLVGALIVGFVGGGAWGAIAGWLKAKRDVNVVISTLLLNYIGLKLVEFALDRKGILRDGDAEPQSAEIAGSARLGRLLGESTSALHLGVPLAVIVALLVWFVLARTVPGFRVRMLGHNQAMAARTGISVQTMSVKVMFISGGLCGLAGCSIILGEQFRARPDFALGFGFAGIAVALIARSNVLAAIPASVLFGAILAGGNLLEARVQVPNAIVSVIQGAIIIAAAGSAFLLRKQVVVVDDAESPPSGSLPSGSRPAVPGMVATKVQS
jgi:general nucleoside transport system permease protein